MKERCIYWLFGEPLSYRIQTILAALLVEDWVSCNVYSTRGKLEELFFRVCNEISKVRVFWYARKDHFILDATLVCKEGGIYHIFCREGEDPICYCDKLSWTIPDYREDLYLFAQCVKLNEDLTVKDAMKKIRSYTFNPRKFDD